jgi:ATP-binding cassette subfamily F protein uup
MALLSLLDLELSFGGPPVLDKVNFQVDPGERVCLVGRNGAGKTSLMRVIAGEMKPDSGSVFRPDGSVATRLPQEIPNDVHGTIHDLVAAGSRDPSGHEEDWEREVRLEDLLARLRLDPNQEFSSLSGGLKRRTLLARALAAQPNLLLLDEPTNHLDVESILWLEEFLLGSGLALFFVTHDRAFLRRLATRIVELDRGRLTSWACDYDTYLVRKQEVLEAEERQQALFDKKLAQEEAWIRRGVRAQRSRAQSRINQLMQMRAERRARRERTGNATLRLAEAERSGVKVVNVENMSYAWPGQSPLVRDFSTTIIRGDKIGLIGPNGAGKTTLIKLLLGQLAPTAGTVVHGTKLEVVYFDQLRAQIDDTKTVADNVADGNATVTIEGRTRNVISYLQDFLFEPGRARTPARVLSGGERNRLLLARLFTKPANVLVLDEPTNDLDAETLELLEDLLVEFNGTLLVISHDREFLDNVVTSTLVFEGGGRIGDYVGGYTDWLAQRPVVNPDKSAAKAAPAKNLVRGNSAVAGGSSPETTAAERPSVRKISNKERKELETLPARIEALEREQAELAARLADPAFYKSDPAQFLAATQRLEALERDHAQAFARWEELEAASAPRVVSNITG